MNSFLPNDTPLVIMLSLKYWNHDLHRITPLWRKNTQKNFRFIYTEFLFFCFEKWEFIFSFNFLSCSNNPIPLIILCLAFILYFHHFMIHLKLTGWELWPLFWQSKFTSAIGFADQIITCGLEYLTWNKGKKKSIRNRPYCHRILTSTCTKYKSNILKILTSIQCLVIEDFLT